jgi:hypothetical protein
MRLPSCSFCCSLCLSLYLISLCLSVCVCRCCRRLSSPSLSLPSLARRKGSCPPPGAGEKVRAAACWYRIHPSQRYQSSYQ